MILPLILTIALLFALPPIDPDLGWFLRCGQESCATNTFSVLLPGYQWYRPMIIYPSIVSFIFYHFSFWGLTILNILFGLTSFFFFHKILKTSLAVSVLAFIASTFLSFSTLSLGFRNQSLSILFFLLTIYLLEKKRFFLLPLLFFIWANTHPGFPVGLALILFTKKIKIFIVSIAATLINPFGISIYQDIFSHFTTPMNTLVAEWVPPSPLHIVFIIFITVITIIISLSRPRRPFFYFLALIFTAILALQARRNLPFFYFLLPLTLYKLYNRYNLYFLIPLFSVLLPIITIITAAFILPNTIDVNSHWLSYCHKGITNFPCEATQFLKSQPAGNIFNTYEWGGFLIWQLPQFKVFIDGRMPAWRLVPSEAEGPAISPYFLYLSTYQTQALWRETLEKYKIDYILISPGTFLDLELKTNKYPWKEIFKSEFSVIYKKIS